MKQKERDVITVNMAEAKQMVVACYKANEPLLLLGEPGMGKTSMVEHTAKEDLEIGFIDNRLTMKDVTDVGGMRIPDVKTGVLKHYVPEDLPIDVKRHGPEGIMLYDEINVVPMLMQAAAYGIIQERRVGQQNLLPGWVPMGSGNNMTDGAAAQRISSALANRFCVIHVKPELQPWLEQYGSANVDPRGVAFLRWRPALFHVMPKKGSDVIQFPTARSWTKAFKFIDQPPALRKKIISGYVGPDPAGEFEAYWRIMETATTFDEILADPLTARVPEMTDAGTYFAVVGMLGRLTNKTNIKRVAPYLERFYKDYQAAFWSDATSRDPGMKETKAYCDWAVASQKVLT